jgi:hypothetical protein
MTAKDHPAKKWAADERDAFLEQLKGLHFVTFEKHFGGEEPTLGIHFGVLPLALARLGGREGGVCSSSLI